MHAAVNGKSRLIRFNNITRAGDVLAAPRNLIFIRIYPNAIDLGLTI